MEITLQEWICGITKQESQSPQPKLCDPAGTARLEVAQECPWSSYGSTLHGCFPLAPQSSSCAWVKFRPALEHTSAIRVCLPVDGFGRPRILPLIGSWFTSHDYSGLCGYLFHSQTMSDLPRTCRIFVLSRKATLSTSVISASHKYL